MLLVTPTLSVEIQTEFIDEELAVEEIHEQRVRYYMGVNAVDRQNDDIDLSQVIAA